MPNFGPYESEVAFISGITDANTAAAVSYYTMESLQGPDGKWLVTVPTAYTSMSGAIKWGGSAQPGTPGGTVTYWFDAAASWTPAEQAVWTGAFGLWSGLADIDFALASSAGAANITVKRLANQQAYASFGVDWQVPVGSAVINGAPQTGAYVTIDTSHDTYGPLDGDPNTKGGYPYSTVIHEIGHILGLGHAGPYDTTVDYQQQQFGPYDTEQWSIMSYIHPSRTDTRYFGDYPVGGTYWDTTTGSDGKVYDNEPLTPQMLDILAIQRLYGEATAGPFSGNQAYGFNANFADPFLQSIYDFGSNPSAIVTIWNSGTGNALDLSGFSQDANVNLAPGTFSSAGGLANNIAIALGTRIETAFGGGGNDTITANSAVASTLQGNDGNDTLTGCNLDDQLFGNTGNDVLQGGGGADQLSGGDGDDFLVGGDGSDRLNGGGGNDILQSGAGGDVMSGDGGTDIFQFVIGQAQGDTITDFASGDVLQFFGYGSGTVTNVAGTNNWLVTSQDGSVTETITLGNGATLTSADYAFYSPYTQLDNSTFLDFASWRSNTTTPPTGGTAVGSGETLAVALVFDRANDPSSLLSSSWASRQQQLEALQHTNSLWSTYGADLTDYEAAKTVLDGLGIQRMDVVDPGNSYISSAQSRTIWVEITGDSFSTLFGPSTKLMDSGGNWYWTGSLSLPTELTDLGVSGLWFDTQKFQPPYGNTSVPAAVLPQGSQSPGNNSTQGSLVYPQVAVQNYYNMPLSADMATGTIGLVEPVIGTALPGDNGGSGFQAAVDAYRAGAGVATGAPVITVGNQNWGTAPNGSGERSLDTGMVAAIAPQSPLVFYSGSGLTLADAFTAYQSAFWDDVNNPQVITSSFRYTPMVAPGSPFFKASAELFVDAALRNITVFNSNGDGGSGYELPNGLTNINTSRSSPFSVTVGGTSISSTLAALNDDTLQGIVDKAASGDLATIWDLVAGGMTQSPVGMSGGSAALIETAWNVYYLNGTTFSNRVGTGYRENNTGSGGADPTFGIPSYQADYGLVPFTADPYHLVGRGTPDVSANAGGNLYYIVPTGDMTGTESNGGTSAATPLWAALGAQLNAIFEDQNLPHLGYANDLLYIASAIAPASFNDIRTGNNTSSYVLGGDYTSDGVAITPTGYGYTAGPGYDLTSGLGTPNGVLLARALTGIAHHQMSFADNPDLIDLDAAGNWITGDVRQSLLIQATSTKGTDTEIKVEIGGFDDSFTNHRSGDFAWTARFAQQSLQADFDPNLVRLYDKYAHGSLLHTVAESNADVSMAIGRGLGFADQAQLTSPYGIADFATSFGTVHLARAVAVAETVGGANDQVAVVRMRQNGEDTLSVSLYKVDDYTGSIGGLKPGQAGYAEAAESRAYLTGTGGTSLQGGGYGNYAQGQIVGVDAGDLIAMKLTNQSTGKTSWAFAEANEKVDGKGVGHLWNYDYNTWGWEDQHGGGDRDFNDLVVMLDFTSAYGNQWLM
ncbi:M10 family metallopeptidase C-terminal domain-containing protein [Reyranella soli]|uniref:Peptidase S53 domain-containing protein n=1 Tax=Reyranella soli TaxID=1230389 RepID=A0A512N864_9HYPH|nr:M10 family metallopeptidase C-terminal domain-containing protein [Reyranella soli]GEP55167.1 hypothetical protein RSO01_23330 [Reyranella soli]